MRFLISIFLFYLRLALPYWSSWHCIFDVSILSLAIGQCRHAHLLLFKSYLLIVPISVSQAIPDPKQRTPFVVFIIWQLFIRLRRCLFCD